MLIIIHALLCSIIMLIYNLNFKRLESRGETCKKRQN